VDTFTSFSTVQYTNMTGGLKDRQTISTWWKQDASFRYYVFKRLTLR